MTETAPLKEKLSLEHVASVLGRAELMILPARLERPTHMRPPSARGSQHRGGRPREHGREHDRNPPPTLRVAPSNVTAAGPRRLLPRCLVRTQQRHRLAHATYAASMATGPQTARTAARSSLPSRLTQPSARSYVTGTLLFSLSKGRSPTCVPASCSTQAPA